LPLDLPDFEAIVAASGISGVEFRDAEIGMLARVPHESVERLLTALRGAGFESLVDFDGVDTGGDIELTWRVRSYAHGAEAVVKTAIPYDGTIESVWTTYPSALMPERETAELFGLGLDGHPNPKRLLTTDGVPPLLRRDVPIRTPEEFRR
jgi:NADH:ubiquinone oxidoreductase subunit C